MPLSQIEMGKLKNRPEIDGLRAVAVIPVVLYHAAMGFPGGYVGVDVFFVISGFLITSLILTDLNAGNFQLLSFWERRVRRIAPALSLMAIFWFDAAGRIFSPSDFEQFGRAAAFQSVML